MTATWRQNANKCISKVIKDNPLATIPELKKLLREAYPWGPRKYWPYKVWCSEVRAMLTQVERLRAHKQQLTILDKSSLTELPLFKDLTDDGYIQL